MMDEILLPPSPHIVVVDDDPVIRATLRDCLEAGGYRVTETSGKAGMMAAIARGPVDLITLDLRLGAESGIALARELRAGSEVPIIMITGMGEPVDRAIGLETGADDYITKPFHLRELLARVANVLRRARPREAAPAATRETGAPPPARFVFDGWSLDCQRRRLSAPQGGSCTLTASEFTLLRTLLQHANRVLSRDEIMDLVKGPHWVANDRVIDNQIRRLRRKLRSLESKADLIRSVRGAGYVMTATVRGFAGTDLPPRP